ncbi:GNAT family N-acetyltransferase [Lentisphaera profundi]|uniref:GNAT family N-acetyltransferase n=1 Tax=Lentisphaera profundi TaxID=1658616 RepID=A0ABY7VSR9_9BACT|nr:GNAT family N-acetyltransferase [Lentisphaera profundi]WDE96946.1 GNAT family N-acetyltransferase [Lentisphaera profundi]
MSRLFFAMTRLEYPEIFLTRSHLNDLPNTPLPEGYYFRNYQFEDEENWFRIYEASDNYNKVYSTTFREYFGAKVKKLEQRQIYICNQEGLAVATATAWNDENFHGEHWGRIHWLAVHPDFQGLGLAKCLLNQAMQRLKACGHEKAYLRTYTMREKAIKLYLNFGFTPLISSVNDEEVWKSVAKKVDHKLLATWRDQ